MIHAYDKLYLSCSRVALARMLDYIVNDLKFTLNDAFDYFINSGFAKKFENGVPGVLAGMSGVELAYEIMPRGTKFVKPSYSFNRSKEYWLGWALAYYQWHTSFSFSKILGLIDANDIADMYYKYHELDIRHFCENMNRVISTRQNKSNLKSLRERASLSQSALAEKAGIPVRTIQQYEQGQKNINKSSAEYIISLSRVLCCEPSDLLEVL